MARTRKIVSLADRRLEPNPDVVTLLTDLLARAERGEIRGLAFGASCDANCDASGFALGDAGIAPLVLGIERAKKRLLQIGEE